MIGGAQEAAGRDDDALERFRQSSTREMLLLVERDGTVRQLDGPARRLLGLEPGDQLDQVLAYGGEAKLEELLATARRQKTTGWELSFRIDDAPATVLLCGEPADDGVVLLASLVPEDYGKLLRETSDTMSEVVDLNRRIQRQKRELQRIGRELDESNRGMLALHDELDESHEAIGRSHEIKTRVLANVSHEFRTPLHSILGLSKLLLDETDGPLNSEQTRQARYIHTAAGELAHLVDDVLDLSKLDSGTIGLRVETFGLDEFVGTLRGMLRPLAAEAPGVELRMEVSDPQGDLETDRGKLSQILRNLVGNALKFTSEGSVTLSVKVLPPAQDGGSPRVAFSVTDTGVGIARHDQERIFEEFEQVVSMEQKGKPMGTGLGLALSSRLADLLGGRLSVESELGAGSTFTLELPAIHPEVEEMAALVERGRAGARAGKSPILIVEDDRKTLFVYERYLAQAGFHVLPARTIDEARDLLGSIRPQAIVLDIMLERETTWRFLEWLKTNPETRDIPVHVVTVTDREQRARALGADEFWLKPIDQEQLIAKLASFDGEAEPIKVLVIDDEPAARYLIRRYLVDQPYEVLEAVGGEDGVQLAIDEAPSVILLDFLLEDQDAFDVLDELKADPRTRSIPVVINTSLDLPSRDRSRLTALADGIIQKQSLSRELAITRIRDALHRAEEGRKEKRTDGRRERARRETRRAES